MREKNRDGAEHPKADVWEQHLHDMDLMNRTLDENTARYLARFKEDVLRDKAVLEATQQEQQPPEVADVPFWITEK